MRRLDRNAPYSEVHGLPGAAYEQNGILFNVVGEEAITRPYEEDLEELSWQKLKALVEEQGGEWVNKKEAVSFLKGAA